MADREAICGGPCMSYPDSDFAKIRSILQNRYRKGDPRGASSPWPFQLSAFKTMNSALLLKLLPGLCAGGVYALSALLLKRAFNEGARPGQSLMFSNLMMAALALPFCVYLGPHPHCWLAAGCVVAITFVGQIAGFWGIRLGSVSVMTPMLGLKPLIVAFLASFLAHEALTWNIWAAAALTTCALVFLGASERNNSSQTAFIQAAGAALACCACFALADVLIERWAPQLGVLPFIAYTTLFMGLPALVMLAFQSVQESKQLRLSPVAWKFLLWGCGLTALQTLILVIFIAYIGEATLINITYNTRGLWSLALIALIGRYMGIYEHKISKKALTQRLVGAGGLFAAIVLVLGG